MASKKKKPVKSKARPQPKRPAAVAPAPARPTTPGAGQIQGDPDVDAVPPQFVSADDLKEILLRADQDRQGRETAEARVQTLTADLEAVQNKLKAQRPVRFDEEKVKAAAVAVQLAILMDVKGALTALALESPEAAKAVLRIQALEAQQGALVTVATVLIQRAKIMADRRKSGLELTSEDFNDLLAQAEKLL